MNVENINLIADLIEANPTQFDMEEPLRIEIGGSDRGCIGAFIKSVTNEGGLCNRAIESFFEIDGENAHDITYATGPWKKYYKELGISNHTCYHEITAHVAVKFLRGLASGRFTLDAA